MRKPLQDPGTLRILDAAANRAAEGLRVVEDYVRFVLDDRHLTGLCKDLRHDLTATLAAWEPRHRLLARDTTADVGVDVKTDAEHRRTDIIAVVRANFHRAEQALRSLEEYGKLSDPAAARQCEQLRYRVYTLERAIDITRHSLERLADAKLYVLVDGRDSVQSLVALVDELVAAGVHVLQLRDKRLPDRELLRRARAVRARTRGTPTLFVMNDRPDLAALADADGVHVGQDELSVKDARSIVGLDKLVGVSTHSLAQAQQAVLDGANYIGVGPVFASTTKQFTDLSGLDLVAAVHREIRLPAFAIGGITAENVAQVVSAGATRIAVSAAVVQAADPRAATGQLFAALHQSR